MSARALSASINNTHVGTLQEVDGRQTLSRCLRTILHVVIKHMAKQIA